MNKAKRKNKGIMTRVLAWVGLLAFLTFASISKAQDSACLNQLVPCLQYINTKKTPSSGCCDPLKSLIKSDPKCLCSMLGSNSVTKQAGVNTTQAQLLPARCGQKVTASMCSALSRKAKNKGPTSGARFTTPNWGMIICMLIFTVQIAPLLIA